MSVSVLSNAFVNTSDASVCYERAEDVSKCFIPLFEDSVSAGFPSPANDYIDRVLDLNELCIRRPASTFFVRVSGDSMTDAGIFDQDILVVDRSISPKHEDFVIASLDGEFTIKKLCLKPVFKLEACNKNYPDITIKDDWEVFGVVVSVVRSFFENRMEQ